MNDQQTNQISIQLKMERKLTISLRPMAMHRIWSWLLAHTRIITIIIIDLC